MTEKATVLFVDDEERIVRSLRMLFRDRYAVVATTDPDEALRTVRARQVHAVVSDQRMPRMQGAQLLRHVRQISPHTLRILLTGYSELDAVIASVNEGEIFRFVNKPWKAEELRATVAQAVDIASALFAGGERPGAAGGAVQAAHLLVLDEDPMTAEVVREAVHDASTSHAVHWCDTLEEAFDMLSRHDIAVLLSELRLDDEDISSVLKTLKQHHPEILTIILTSFKDTTTLINLINQGQVFRFLPKPLSRNLLGRSIQAALRYHETLRASPQLTQAHAVAPLLSAHDLRIADRLRHFLERMRGRPRVGSYRP